MRIVFFGNNWTGWQVLRYLVDQGEEVVGAVLHAPGARAYEAELLSEAERAGARVFDAATLNTPETLAALTALKPELGVSVLFNHRLEPRLLDLFPRGGVNLHPSLLPYNRGQYPNVWSIIDGTPAGTTLHYMDAEIDTGDIVAQAETPVTPYDTGETLYRRLERASLDLFVRTWPQLRAGTAPRRPQSGRGTTHRTRDVDAIDRIDLDATYTARELINRLRARTFSPYPGVYFEEKGARVYLRLELLREDEL